MTRQSARTCRCGTRATSLRRVTEFQVTLWRDLPSLVVARDGDEVVKSPLGARFQEAIDEAAMRLGDTSSDDYLSGWIRGDWTPAAGSITDVCDKVVADFEEQWPAERLAQYLDELGPRA
jgi:hypothetical protein